MGGEATGKGAMRTTHRPVLDVDPGSSQQLCEKVSSSLPCPGHRLCPRSSSRAKLKALIAETGFLLLHHSSFA